MKFSNSDVMIRYILKYVINYSLRLRKDIRTLFANHSVCNASKAILDEDLKEANGTSNDGAASASSNANKLDKKKAFLCKLKKNLF